MAKTPSKSTAVAVASTSDTIELKAVNGHGWVTSQQVADRFGKRHDTVLRSIRNLECSADFMLRNFAEHGYIDGRGNTQPVYEMSRDGFAILAMGFTGPEAMAWKESFIAAFNQLEQAYIQQIQANAQKAIEGAHYEAQLFKVTAKEKQRHIDAGITTLERIKKETDPHKRELLHCSLKHLYAVFNHPMPGLQDLVPALPAPEAQGPSCAELADRVEELEDLRDHLLRELTALMRLADDGKNKTLEPARQALKRAQADQEGGTQ